MEPMSRSMESSVGPLTEKQLDERSAVSRPIRQIGYDRAAGDGGAGKISHIRGRIDARLERPLIRALGRSALLCRPQENSPAPA